jgi:heat shock protein HslJ
MASRSRLRRLLLAAAPLLAAAAVTAGVVSCSSTSKGASSAPPGSTNVLQHLTAGEWVFDRATSSPRIGGTTPVTLTFTSGLTLSGAAPCNQYMGSFTLQASTIKIGPLAQTLRACESETENAAEQAYLTALGAVHTVASTDLDHLELKGSDGVDLRYQPAPRQTP